MNVIKRNAPVCQDWGAEEAIDGVNRRNHRAGISRPQESKPTQFVDTGTRHYRVAKPAHSTRAQQITAIMFHEARAGRSMKWSSPSDSRDERTTRTPEQHRAALAAIDAENAAPSKEDKFLAIALAARAGGGK